MKKVRLGIIGIGNMGTGHAKNIIAGKCPEIQLTAVADINPDRLQWAKENLPDTIKRFDDALQMLDSGLLDAALVAVPHYDHPKYAMACFDRGLHVMVEKPAGVYTKQVREMNEASEKSNVVFGMMFNQRTSGIYRKMRDLVQKGGYGQIKRTNWIITDWYRSQYYYDSGSWRATWAGEGGGVLLNQCPHNLDLWQWICGMPVKVSAHMYFGKWHDIEVEDDVTAFVEYENGATGTFVTTTADAPGTNRFEITMEGAKLVAEDGKLYLWELETNEREFCKISKDSFAKPKTTFREVEPYEDGGWHVGVLNAFAGAILHGTPLIAGGEEGINGLTLSNAMHLSQWLDKPIALPLDEDLFYEELQKRVASSKQKTGRSVFSDTGDSY